MPLRYVRCSWPGAPGREADRGRHAAGGRTACFGGSSQAATQWFFRPPAPVSTCFATTATGRMSSSQPCANSRRRSGSHADALAGRAHGARRHGAPTRSVTRDGGGAMLALAGLGGAGLATTSRETLPLVDRALIGVVALLIMIGTVMVYSASISLADSPRFNVAPTHFLVRHLFSLSIALCAAIVAFQVPIATWQRFAPWLFVAAFVLLVLVLDPRRRQRCQRGETVDTARHPQPATVGTDEGRVRPVCGELHRPQAGLHASLRQGISRRWRS